MGRGREQLCFGDQRHDTTRAGQWGPLLDQIVDEASAYADDYVTLEIVNLVKEGRR